MASQKDGIIAIKARNFKLSNKIFEVLWVETSRSMFQRIEKGSANGIIDKVDPESDWLELAIQNEVVLLFHET